MAKVTALQQKNKPVFNPQTAYNWQPDDVFEFTGQQLAYLYHALTKEVHTTEGATPAQLYEAYNAILEVFKRGVEQGAIIEAGEEGKLKEEVEQNVEKLFKIDRDPTKFPHHHNHPNG